MNRMLPLLGLVLVPALLEGCKGCVEEPALPTVLVAVDASPVGVWAGEGVGDGTVEVPVFATNGLGAVVSGVDVTVTSTGTLASSIATIDGTGWGTASVEGAEGVYTVDASIAGGTAQGHAWSAAAWPGSFEYGSREANGYVSEIAFAGDGVVWAVEDALWWGSLDGKPPVRVATLSGEVKGLVACAVDADGRTDLLAWSASSVLLLRGRDGGGLYFGAGWGTAGGEITGAAVVDHSEDALMDLAVVSNVDGAADVLLLDGDGRWGFTPSDAFHVEYLVYGLSLEDLDSDGDHEVTLLTEDGLLRRYARFDEGWSSTSTSSQFELGMGKDTRLLPSVDVTGDGSVDLIAYGPLLDTDVNAGKWQAWVITAGASTAMMYSMFSGAVDFALPDALGVASGDFTGDGYADLALSTPTSLVRASWSGGDSTFRLQSYQSLPSGPIAIGSFDGDDVPDFVIGGAWIGYVPGARTEDDAATTEDETVDWRPRTSTATLFNLASELEPHVGDVTGDGITDVVSVVAGDAGGLQVTAFLGVPETETDVETLFNTGSALLPEATTPVDVAVCGSRAFVLATAVDTTTALYRVDIGASGAPSLVGTEGILVSGVAVRCGAFADGEAMVIAVDGTVTTVDTDGGTVLGNGVGTWVGVAAGDVDGDGFDELVTCAVAGCELAVGDFDGDEVDDVATAGAASLEVAMGGAVLTLTTPGSPRATDADGDGRVDLVLGADGAVHIHHGMPGGLAPAAVDFVWRPVMGPALFGDLNGDGVPDAFMPVRETDGTSATGSLLYARATPAI